MPVSEQLIAAEATHAVSTTRYAQGVGRSITDYLKQSADYVEARLAREGATITTLARANKAKADINKRLKAIYNSWYKEQFNPAMLDLVATEGLFQQKMTDSVITGFETVTPAPQQVITAATRNLSLIHISEPTRPY